MKIDTTKDFTKHVGSLQGATRLVRSLLEGESLDWTTGMRGRTIAYARGTQKKFDWSYDTTYKTVSITYTDGRPQPEEKEKPEYYVVWIEGISPERGEKILSLKNGNHTYTLSMGKAMRVLPEDRETVKEILRNQGIANWAIENCMVRTNYAPAGTIFKL